MTFPTAVLQDTLEKMARIITCTGANGGMTNGDVLSKNYKDFDGVKDLVSGGDMITLCATKEQTKYYNTENSKKILVSEELESIKYLFSVGIKNPVFAFVKNQGWYCSENKEKFFPLLIKKFS